MHQYRYIGTNPYYEGCTALGQTLTILHGSPRFSSISAVRRFARAGRLLDSANVIPARMHVDDLYRRTWVKRKYDNKVLQSIGVVLAANPA